MTATRSSAAGTASVVVNGDELTLGGATPHTSALDWLRSLGLTGCKEGCAEGECGACAILVARQGTTNRPGTQWTAVNACLVPVAALDGQEVVTAEGLGTPERLHPVQRELAERGGSQCGYCTPGFVCSMVAEYYRPDRKADAARPADDEHGPNGFDLHSLSGNLCRCTGYRPIRDAAYALGEPAPEDPLTSRLASAAPRARATSITADGAGFVRPADLAAALELIAARADAVVLAGGTDVAVGMNLRGERPVLLVAVDRLPELRVLAVDDDQVRIGAALTLTEIERGLAGRVPLLEQLLAQFASRLIRNSATLGGNLGTASPIGDAAPALLALGASVVLSASGGERVVPLDAYFTGYRQSVRTRGELIREVRIPLPLARVAAFHKVAKRRFDDISSVAVAFALEIVEGRVTRARIGLGGVAATPIRALRTEAALEGEAWSEQTVQAAAAVLAGEGTPISDLRASEAYRRAMLGQSLRRLFASGVDRLDGGAP